MADWAPPPFHKQCSECHTILEGPAAGEQPGQEVHHISDDGTLLLPSGDAEHPANVSHGVCDSPACQESYTARYRDWIARRKAERAAEQQAGQPSREEPEA